MKFKGFNFRRNRNLVPLPARDNKGSVPAYVNPANASTAYLWFGKVTRDANAAGAVRTQYKWPDASPVFAVPVPIEGHSLTNMAYGTKGEVYLMHDGACYQARISA